MSGGNSINTKVELLGLVKQRTKFKASEGTFLAESQRKSLNETLYPRLPEVGPTEKQVNANRSSFKYYYFGLTQTLQR